MHKRYTHEYRFQRGNLLIDRNDRKTVILITNVNEWNSTYDYTVMKTMRKYKSDASLVELDYIIPISSPTDIWERLNA